MEEALLVFKEMEEYVSASFAVSVVWINKAASPGDAILLKPGECVRI